jgi:hypothetical protein
MNFTTTINMHPGGFALCLFRSWEKKSRSPTIGRHARARQPGADASPLAYFYDGVASASRIDAAKGDTIFEYGKC